MTQERSAKELRFIEEYLIDFNGTQAAIRAGYSKKTARQIASRLLSKANVQADIAAGQKELREKSMSLADRIKREYERLAFLDLRKAFDEHGHIKPLTELDDDTAAAITGFDVEDLYEGRGESREHVGRVKKIRTADKKAALDSLARHVGFFERDNRQKADALSSMLASMGAIDAPPDKA